ncbi:MAG: hypothetical protein CML40_07970 [Rhodobacteraceae bacterium]|nr:MAG: hypothetical protein CML40_07970 [Paracoccaceae bacterium]
MRVCIAMSEQLAPRPFNEEQRVKAVVKTGLIDAPKPEIFQVYCDLAKTITGFATASFSLFDGDVECAISATGKDDFEVGAQWDRDKNNICSYVLLDTEPLLMNDVWSDPTWKNHPKAIDKTGARGYAGFPVVNKDNYALGTLCMTNPKPKSLDEEKISLVKKITENMALLLDVQADQKEITSQKVLEALAIFQGKEPMFSLDDFKSFLMLSADLRMDDTNSKKLVDAGLCYVNEKNGLKLTKMGRQLQVNMKLESKPMRKIKLSGDAAENLIDEMFESLN